MFIHVIVSFSEA